MVHLGDSRGRVGVEPHVKRFENTLRTFFCDSVHREIHCLLPRGSEGIHCAEGGRAIHRLAYLTRGRRVWGERGEVKSNAAGRRRRANFGNTMLTRGTYFACIKKNGNNILTTVRIVACGKSTQACRLGM